jgi:plasmid maintenance system antidote protein VapI
MKLVSPSPGELVLDLLHQRNLSKSHLQEVTGLSNQQMIDLERGQLKVSPDLAEMLEYFFSVPEKTWIQLQLNYEKQPSRFPKHD